MKNPIQSLRDNRNSMRAFQQVQTDLERLFEEMAPWSSHDKEFAFNPRCDVTEDKDRFEMKFDLPGVTKEQIRVEFSDNTLTVSAERKLKEEKTENKGASKKFISEVGYGAYARSISLPRTIDEKSIQASYENGVLTVTVKKLLPEAVKQIPVQ